MNWNKVRPAIAVRVWDGGTDGKTEGGDGGGIVEDVTISIMSDKNGQDQVWVHIRGTNRWDGLERKHARQQDWGGMNMYGGKYDGYIGIRMLRMELSGKRKRGRPKWGIWMRWKRTWLRLKWRRRIKKIGTTGGRKSAVATPDGKSRKKKMKKHYWGDQHETWHRQDTVDASQVECVLSCPPAICSPCIAVIRRVLVTLAL